MPSSTDPSEVPSRVPFGERVARCLWRAGLGAVVGSLLGLGVSSLCGAHVGYGVLFGAIVGFLIACAFGMAGLELLYWVWPH